MEALLITVKQVEMKELKLALNVHWFFFKDINFIETFEELKW